MTENGGCNQTCTNQVGSFTCSCDIGFELSADGLDCDGQLSYEIMKSNSYISFPVGFAHVAVASSVDYLKSENSVFAIYILSFQISTSV